MPTSSIKVYRVTPIEHYETSSGKVSLHSVLQQKQQEEKNYLSRLRAIWSIQTIVPFIASIVVLLTALYVHFHFYLCAQI